MREIRTYGLTRGRALRDIRGVPLYSTAIENKHGEPQSRRRLPQVRVSNCTAAELITNGGFDECEEGCTPPVQYANLSASLKLSGWTWGGSVGMSKSYSNCPWLRVGTLNGDYAIYFQKIASITQTIDVVEAGTYVVSFGYIHCAG